MALLTVPDLILWLQEQPPEQTYNFNGNRTCLIAQYLVGRGRSNVKVGGYTIDFDDLKDVALPEPLSKISITQPWTFGAALTRAIASESTTRI